MLKVLLLCFSLLGFAPSMLLAAEIHGRVIGILDGDTIDILAGRNIHRIRLAGIDAPEKGQPFGQAAKKALSDKVFGRDIRVFTIEKDRYGREIGRVFADSDVNLAMVAEGYAWVYERYADSLGQDRPTFEDAKERARKARAGLWRDPSPTPPWEYRRAGGQ